MKPGCAAKPLPKENLKLQGWLSNEKFKPLQVGTKKVFKTAKAIEFQHNGRVDQEEGRPVWATNLRQEGDTNAQIQIHKYTDVNT